MAGYDAQRTAFGQFIVEHARALGSYMEAQVDTATQAMKAEPHRTAEAVMRDTAVAPANALFKLQESH